MSEEAKRQAAKSAALKLLSEHYLIIGSGSTVNLFIDQLAYLHKSISQLHVLSGSVSTSEKLKEHKIKEISLNDFIRRKAEGSYYCVDGADEVILDRKGQPEIILKGHGNALIREKLLWELADKTIVMIDDSKTNQIISKFIPIEVLPFAIPSVLHVLKTRFSRFRIEIRKDHSDQYLKTDNGNNIIELHHQGLNEGFEELDSQLKLVTGIVGTGLFTKPLIENVELIQGNSSS